MSSQRRIDASRANGSLSGGPKTPEGRRRSAKNKIRHGILAQTVVLDDEDRDEFVKLLSAFEAEYSPQTQSESVLVDHLAVSTWRMMRIWGIEKAGLLLEIKKHDPTTHDAATRASMAFRTLSDDSRSLELLHRYETRYDRQYARAYRLLNAKQNLPCEPSPTSEHSQAPASDSTPPGDPIPPHDPILPQASIPPHASVPPHASMPPRASIPPRVAIPPHDPIPPRASAPPHASLPLPDSVSPHASIPPPDSIPPHASIPPRASVPPHASLPLPDSIPPHDPISPHASIPPRDPVPPHDRQEAVPAPSLIPTALRNRDREGADS